MKEVFKTDARELKEFGRIGYHYTKIEETDTYMVWELTKDNKSYGYEIWKFKKAKNPDGQIVWAKPSDEEFGKYAWYGYNLESLKSKVV